MKDRPRDLNQTWPVGRKWCRFTNAPKKFWAPPPNFGRKKHHILYHFFATSALSTTYLWNETSHRHTKMLLSIWNVSPKSWPTFRDLWRSNGWDPLAHCDPSYENSAFSVIAGLPTQRPLNSGQEIVPAVTRLKELTIHCKKIRRPLRCNHHGWDMSS